MKPRRWLYVLAALWMLGGAWCPLLMWVDATRRRNGWESFRWDILSTGEWLTGAALIAAALAAMLGFGLMLNERER